MATAKKTPGSLKKKKSTKIGGLKKSGSLKKKKKTAEPTPQPGSRKRRSIPTQLKKKKTLAKPGSVKKRRRRPGELRGGEQTAGTL